MTTDRRRVRTLAELDADLADPSVPGPDLDDVRADPASRDVLDALAATRADLAALPPVAAPPEFAARWSGALAAESAPESADPVRWRGGAARPEGTDELPPPAGHGPARVGRRPSRRRPVPPGPADSRPATGSGGRAGGRRPRPAVVVGLLIAIALVAAGIVRSVAAPPTVDAGALLAAARGTVGVQDAGELTDPARRAECLRTVGPPDLSPGAPLAGGRRVTFEGRPAVVLLLVTGRLGQLRAVAVDPGCSALLGDVVVGG